jgi:hypothetical protein
VHPGRPVGPGEDQPAFHPCGQQSVDQFRIVAEQTLTEQRAAFRRLHQSREALTGADAGVKTIPGCGQSPVTITPQGRRRMDDHHTPTPDRSRPDA